jgi:hypothetical protein
LRASGLQKRARRGDGGESILADDLAAGYLRGGEAGGERARVRSCEERPREETDMSRRVAWLSAAAAAGAIACGGAAVAQNYMNVLGNYGRLDQKNLSMRGAMPEFGRWSCGPTSLANSLAYLQKQFPDHYQRTLIPMLPPNNNAATITNEEILDVAEDLASPAYMNQSKGTALADRLPPRPPLPYEYERDYDSITPATNSGGVTYERFFFGKNCWFTRGGVPFTRLYGEYRHVWNAAEGGNPAAVPKPGWVKDSARLDVDLMFRHLREKSDVELGFSWATFLGNGDVGLTGGGHLVTVYGYDFVVMGADGRDVNGDVNGNGKFDPGDFATLKIIDPWAPVPDNINNVAPAINAVISWTVLPNGAQRVTVGYNGGAAGNGGFGVVEAWASEVPGPGGAAAMAVGVVVMGRRRRRPQGA